MCCERKSNIIMLHKIFTYQQSALGWFVQVFTSHGFAKHGVIGTPGKQLILGHWNSTGKTLATGY